MTAGDDSLTELLDRPLEGTSIDALRGLFLKGAKTVDDWMLGLEIELIPLLIGKPDSVGHERIAPIIETLGKMRSMTPEVDPTGALVGLSGGGHILSLEPGGQVELATRPYRRLHDLMKAVGDLSSDLAVAAGEHGVRLLSIGHHPYANRHTVPKMPKARYDLMREYLPTRGSRGLDMMHLTGSVQCAVDFSDEENLTAKIRTAARVSPFLSALVSASPFFEGKPSGVKDMRYEIWRDVDNSRSGIWPEMLDAEGLTLRRYVEKALSVPAMLFRREGRFAIAEPIPYRELAKRGFRGTTVTVADFVDHLTTLFPEIRIKSYIELRGADCVNPELAVAIAGFWRGVLDVPSARAEIDARLGALDHGGLVALQAEVAKKGLDAVSAVGSAREIATWLAQTAYVSLRDGAPDCAECVMPLVEQAKSGRSPADEMLERYAQGGIEAALAPLELPRKTSLEGCC
ncbi:MAG: glutamate-cysteine ligase family protein [Myxococcota bacterium]